MYVEVKTQPGEKLAAARRPGCEDQKHQTDPNPPGDCRSRPDGCCFESPAPLRRTQSIPKCIDGSGQLSDLRIDITPMLLDQLTVHFDAGFEDGEIGVACVRLGRPEPNAQAAEDTLICYKSTCRYGNIRVITVRNMAESINVRIIRRSLPLGKHLGLPTVDDHP